MDGAGANMRLFKACWMGSCQMSAARPGVTAAYASDEEIVVYTSIDECIDKANYLLNNEAARRKIAMADQARTLRDHTTAQRVAEMHGQIVEMLA